MIGIVGSGWVKAEIAAVLKGTESLSLTGGGAVQVYSSSVNGRTFLYATPMKDGGVLDPLHEADAVAKAGAEAIVYVGLGGALLDDFPVGALAIPSQMMSLSGRFGASQPFAGPVDLAEPFCSELRQKCIPLLEQSDPLVVDGGTVADIPRGAMPTSAEAEVYKALGAGLAAPDVYATALVCGARGRCCLPLVLLVHKFGEPLTAHAELTFFGSEERSRARIRDLIATITRMLVWDTSCVLHAQPIGRQGAPSPRIVGRKAGSGRKIV